MNHKTYIGDSVYAEIEDGMLKLTTNNGYPDDPRNVIYLGVDEWDSLVAYVERLRQSQEVVERRG